LGQLDPAAVAAAYAVFTAHFHDADIQANIRASKEEQYQEGFLRDLFVHVLGYTLNPQKGYELTTEYKNEKGAKKADGAILVEGKALAHAFGMQARESPERRDGVSGEEVESTYMRSFEVPERPSQG
jgi:hypothetical protein